MSQVLEWRERLETAHKMLHDSMTELITKKDYSEAERGLHVVDQLMLNVIEDMGGTVVRSGVWTRFGILVSTRSLRSRSDKRTCDARVLQA